MSRPFRLKPICWSLAALICLHGCAPALQPATHVDAHPDRPDAAITSATSADGTLVIDVTSPSGIGGATLRISGPFPEQVTLRLFLKGMEKLEVAYGQTTLTASLSSAPGHSLIEAVRRTSEPGEQEVQPGSPYWMAVSIVPTGGSPAAIPLQDGYIEVRLPADFARSQERSFSIRWIDFLR